MAAAAGSALADGFGNFGGGAPIIIKGLKATLAFKSAMLTAAIAAALNGDVVACASGDWPAELRTKGET